MGQRMAILALIKNYPTAFFPFDKFLEHLARHAIRVLPQRVLHGIRGDRFEHASYLTVPRNLAAPDGIYDAPTAVGRVLHGQPEFQVYGDVAKDASFSQEADFVVVLPRHIVAGTYVNILRLQRDVQNGLHGFGLRYLFRHEPVTVEHV
jgi:hypothetical protein